MGAYKLNEVATLGGEGGLYSGVGLLSREYGRSRDHACARKGKQCSLVTYVRTLAIYLSYAYSLSLLLHALS